MILRSQHISRLSLVAASVAASSSLLAAQGLIVSQGVVVATSSDPVPDSAGMPIPNVTFGNTIDDCVLDESGSIAFRAQLVDSVTPVTGINDRAIFYGSSRATLKMVARGGDQAPGAAPGVLLRSATGTSTSLASSVRLSPDGRLWWASKVWDNNMTITASNDDPCFGGLIGAQGPLFSDGDIAPGTGGAQFAQAFSSPAAAFEGMNRNGHVFLRATLVTGTGVPPVTTTVGVNNQQGVWTGLPGSLSLVVRKSDPVQGLGGEVAIDNSNSLVLHTAINDSNKLLFDLSLSTTQGAPAATAANDRVLMVHTPGSGNQVLVRESDSAPGTSGGTFNSISVTDNWGPSLSPNVWTRSDEVIFNTELRGGDTVAGINDRAIYRGGVGSLVMVVRRGDVAAGTGGETYNGFNSSNTLHNAGGRVAFQGFLNLVGAVTSANDTGIWYGTPGSLQLVVREGDVLPGTGGGTCGPLNGANMFFNDADQILFLNTIVGGTASGNSMWIWDVAQGLRAVVLNGDQIEVSPGVFKTVNSAIIGNSTIGNTDGAALTFGHDGTAAMRLNFTDNSRAVMVIRFPSNVPEEFCSNSTLGGDHTTPCPCGNVGAAGNGCAHSFDANGAHLGATGAPAMDDVVLHSSNTPATSFTLFIQHDAANDITFHDGVLCASGNLIRLRGRSAGVAGQPGPGEALFPNGNFANDTQTLSQRGGVTIGSAATRYYAAWYRNASSTFCPPATANVTNGLRILW